ncbi:hypothetical protein GAYE_SCF26G4533 [Galdieria yellowstonensis]|uniref:Uncharacterized protein n=1 Tax=Galdieria yellowstonensis TaxID=3028027 RepID=A0AAV9IGP1_9RHOD|nr:hypothetical protein GAYE_SCF26G4533 [Galdieria yellowstonensis]
MVVSTRSKRDRAVSNKDCEVDKRKSKKRSKPTQVRGNTNEEREETKSSFATSFESSIKSSNGVMSKDNLRELIKELPATVIESLKCRGIERGQWKVKTDYWPTVLRSQVKVFYYLFVCSLLVIRNTQPWFFSFTRTLANLRQSYLSFEAVGSDDPFQINKD